MSAKMEYTGSDVAEAIKNACEKLNAAQDLLDIEIKSAGSAGIFGLCRRKAKILVSLKETAQEMPTADGQEPEPTAPQQQPAGKKEQPRQNGGESPSRREPPKPLSAEAVELIKNDLLRMLELMDAPSTVEVEQQDGKLKLQIAGDHLDQIIGPAGQTLDSIQYLLRKMAGKKMTERVQLSLNAGDFRESRIKELEETAARLAGEVKENGRTKSIPSLNPAERRIVHMILQTDTAIRSRSVGDGLYKKVLIYLPGKGRKRSGKNNRKATAKPRATKEQ